MVFNNKSFSDGLTYHNPLTVHRHPRPQPEFPAPYPARIVGKFEISDGSNAAPHGDAQISRQQRPLSVPFLHDIPREVVAGPHVVLAGEIAVENHDFHSDRRRHAVAVAAA